ncbi:hypothetical protein ELD05_11825 [Caldicellulosiruptor changbaiensis]|uniref:PD-(D/E)XK nuclease domain-containing protein n=1 Tax=Caldicellulosiruptor changbaiensis TaxID=1222016 RepID=A0A3T0D8Y0_9FIRM|nr:PD-(D/E)XK nuclease superfamily protein [Caldicellulosiruptor changbaiensis]AZT91252.1 hypothetical protein ELD05_11825 [Caldicellulosiruptor changbaiensis]
MSPGGRGTRTGRVHENVIEKVLSENYPGRFSKQVFIGTNLFGNKYKADFVLNNNVIISAKWQQKTGTTEQKIVYEIMTLIKILKENNLKEAYIVIGGKGYSRKAKEFYLKQKHIEYIKDGELVEILSLDEFIERANVNKL